MYPREREGQALRVSQFGQERELQQIRKVWCRVAGANVVVVAVQQAGLVEFTVVSPAVNQPSVVLQSRRRISTKLALVVLVTPVPLVALLLGLGLLAQVEPKVSQLTAGVEVEVAATVAAVQMFFGLIIGRNTAKLADDFSQTDEAGKSEGYSNRHRIVS